MTVHAPYPFVSAFQQGLSGLPTRIAGVPPSPSQAGFVQGRRGSVSAESISLPPGGQKPILPFYEKTPEQLKRIKDSISKAWLFKDLDPEQEVSVYGAFKEVHTKAGEVIIKQGDAGNLFYVVESGNLEIFISSFDERDEQGDGEAYPPNTTEEVYSRDGYGKLVQKVGPSGSFGELALMYNVTRAATVVSITPCILWALDRITFRTILMDTAFRKRRMYDQFLSTVPIFRSLSQYERYKIADCLDTFVFQKGDIVIRQGDIGDRFYIVEMGNAAAVKDVVGEDGRTERRTVKLYKKGDFFGELALLRNEPRAASVVATGSPDARLYQGLRVVSMPRDAFDRVMGPLADDLRRQVYSDSSVAPEVIV
ncbi:camp-dependent protein kinase regulatory subunit [Dacryopinax primogenitus]|uniref:cAMP-dependent protein kinase regulatory subunit n=1 Tax=Dacryopinax primogenitus (strain DJM 731) TaxID=1858805 RepID=M5FRT0_DACPD|nr:camp-dependent protein kinase regulatory subunit [Dacryopinax primogenitus]EJT97739.1 camp-dependent protein kinase regulatory subunit [Dacryopinax primogenitus]